MITVGYSAKAVDMGEVKVQSAKLISELFTPSLSNSNCFNLAFQKSKL